MTCRDICYLIDNKCLPSQLTLMISLHGSETTVYDETFTSRTFLFITFSKYLTFFLQQQLHNWFFKKLKITPNVFFFIPNVCLRVSKVGKET